MSFPSYSFPYTAVSAGSLSSLIVNGGKYGCTTTITNVTGDSTMDNNVSSVIDDLKAFKSEVASFLDPSDKVSINGTMTLLPVTSNWYTLSVNNGDAPWNLTFAAETADDVFCIYTADSDITMENIKFNLGNAQANNIYIICNTDIYFLDGGTFYGNFIANGFSTWAPTTVNGTLSTVVASGQAIDGHLSLASGGKSVITTINYVQPTLTLTYRLRQLNRSIVQIEDSPLRNAYHARAELSNSLGKVVGFIETINRVAIKDSVHSVSTDTMITLFDNLSTIALKFTYAATNTSALTSKISSVASAFSGRYTAPPHVTIRPVRNMRVVTIVDAVNHRLTTQ